MIRFECNIGDSFEDLEQVGNDCLGLLGFRDDCKEIMVGYEIESRAEASFRVEEFHHVVDDGVEAFLCGGAVVTQAVLRARVDAVGNGQRGLHEFPPDGVRHGECGEFFRHDGEHFFLRRTRENRIQVDPLFLRGVQQFQVALHAVQDFQPSLDVTF